MAKPDFKLIQIIRNTAKKLGKGSNYQWGHMGSCNCGHLAQEITKLSKSEIQNYAMQRYGDWNKQVVDYCPESGLPIDEIIKVMLDAGLTRDDLRHLEKLSDPKILDHLPDEERYLRYNNRADVVKYLNTWASFLEKQLLDNINISDLKNSEQKSRVKELT